MLFDWYVTRFISAATSSDLNGSEHPFLILGMTEIPKTSASAGTDTKMFTKVSGAAYSM